MHKPSLPGRIACNVLAWPLILRPAFPLAMPVLMIACLRHTSRGEGHA